MLIRCQYIILLTASSFSYQIKHVQFIYFNNCVLRVLNFGISQQYCHAFLLCHLCHPLHLLGVYKKPTNSTRTQKISDPTLVRSEVEKTPIFRGKKWVWVGSDIPFCFSPSQQRNNVTISSCIPPLLSLSLPAPTGASFGRSKKSLFSIIVSLPMIGREISV